MKWLGVQSDIPTGTFVTFAGMTGFVNVLIAGAIAGQFLLLDAVGVGILAAAAVGTLHIILGIAAPSAEVDMIPRLAVVNTFKMIRLGRAGFMFTISLQLISFVGASLTFIYAAVYLRGLAPGDHRGAALGIFLTLMCIAAGIGTVSLSIPISMASTDDDTRALFLVLLLTPTAIGAAGVWWMLFQQLTIPSSVVHIGTATLHVDVTWALVTLAAIQFALYVAGTINRRIRVARNVRKLEYLMDRIDRLGVSSAKRKAVLATVVEVDRTERELLERMITPAQLLEGRIDWPEDLFSLWEEEDSGEVTPPDVWLTAYAVKVDDLNLAEAEKELLLDRLRDVASLYDTDLVRDITAFTILADEPYCQRVALPRRPFRQLSWYASRVGVYLDEYLDAREDEMDAQYDRYSRRLKRAWKRTSRALSGERGEWYNLTNWDARLDTISELGDHGQNVTVGVLKLFADIFESALADVPEFRQARWPTRFVVRLMRWMFRWIPGDLSVFVVRARRILEVVRQMPKEDSDWRALDWLANARRMLLDAVGAKKIGREDIKRLHRSLAEERELASQQPPVFTMMLTLVIPALTLVAGRLWK